MNEVTLELGDGARLTASPQALAFAFIERMRAAEPIKVPAAFAPVTTSRPAIGAEFDRGIYAGLSLHRGEPCKLVLLTDEKESIAHGPATEWALSIGDGMPTRIDWLVLRQNLDSRFKREAYWCAEECESEPSWAWYQYFTFGHQYGYHKFLALRAVAVRRLPL